MNREIRKDLKKVTKTTVINIRHYSYQDCIRHQNYVRIDRMSIFGNPIRIGKYCTREQSIEGFRRYFYNRIEKDEKFRQAVKELKGCILGCWCVDEPISFIREDKQCHGEIILEYLESRKK